MGWQATCRAWLGGGMIFVAAATAAAQPVSQENVVQDSQASTTEPTAGNAASLKTAFDAAFAAYRQELLAIEALRSEYQTADATRREAINDELRERHPQSAAVLDAMVEAGIATYRAAPETYPDVSNLLLAVAEHRFAGTGPSSQGGDDFESALDILQTLIDGGNEFKQLPMWGLVAAYATNQLDLANKYKQMAIESGALNEQPDSKNEVAGEVFGLARGMAESIEQQRKIWAAEKKIRDAEAAADDLPRVRMQTSEGEVVIELFENEAPQAVASFITRVKEGFYDGLTFHRVLPRFMAQGGDPLGTGTGGPGYNIRCECYQENARMHFRGSLSMAHAGRDTGGSQFFLTFLPTAHLNGRHTVFGRVIDGFDVLAKLVRINPDDRGSLPPSKIVKAEVIRDRGHDYSTRFEKLPAR